MLGRCRDAAVVHAAGAVQHAQASSTVWVQSKNPDQATPAPSWWRLLEAAACCMYGGVIRGVCVERVVGG